MENLCNGYSRYYYSVTVDLLSTWSVAVPMGSLLVCSLATGSPTSSSSSSSFCFNEAPGRFWKALELNAVHPVQTAASSSVPVSLDQTLHCLLRTAPSPRQLKTGRDRVLLKTRRSFQQMSRHRHQKTLGSGQFIAWLSVDMIHRQHILYIIRALAPYLGFFYAVWVIIFNKAKHREGLSWPKVSQHKIQEIDTTLYNNLSNPVVMMKGGFAPIPHASVSSYCHGHASCPHRAGAAETSLSSLLIRRRHGIVLNHSQGKCLGTPLPSVRGDGEQNGSPETQQMTPLSEKYAEVTGFLLGKS